MSETTGDKRKEQQTMARTGTLFGGVSPLLDFVNAERAKAQRKAD